ncbi:MAG: outer membrane beta-barrel protein [Pseudomonadota bacterium]
MFGLKSTVLLGAALAAMSFQSAVAQDFFQRDRNVAVLDRPQPEFDPEPIRLGTFEARPSLGLGGYFIDNVFATSDNESSDFAFTFRPEVDIQSNWGRHEVGAFTRVEHFEFVDEGSESVTNVIGGVGGRLDATRDLTFGANGFGRLANEPRTQISILDEFGEPVQFTEFGGGVDAQYERDRIRARIGYDVRDRNFDDVESFDPAFADIDQDFRDNIRQTVTGRVDYAVTRDIAVFTEASYFVRDFDILTELSPGQFETRDSDGFTIRGGLNFEIAAPFRGDIAVGYLEENRDSDAFADISGVSVDGRLQWFPTRLTTVTGIVGRRTSDVGLVTAAAAVNTNASLRVDHELRRNFTIYAQGGLFDTEFEDFARDDTFFDAGIGGIYKLNKRMHLEGFYRYTNRDSTIPTEEFSQNIVGFELKFFP